MRATCWEPVWLELNMSYDSPDSIGEALYPRGLRKTMAMVLFFVTTTTPTVFLWQNPPANPQPNGPIGIARFRSLHEPPSRGFGGRSMTPGFGPGFAAPAPAPSRTASNWLTSFVQLFLATVGGALSLALYYPRWGFKRYAILCGPLVGLGTMFFLGVYLFARTEVYRFEIVFAAMIGAIPGLLLYVLLVVWKTQRLNRYAPLEAVEPSATFSASGYPSASSSSPTIYPPAPR
jgi:hypothetical protein